MQSNHTRTSKFKYYRPQSECPKPSFNCNKIPISNFPFRKILLTTLCPGSCQFPTCNLDEQQLGRSDQLSLSAVDPFARPQTEDTITTSTSVFVAEPGSALAVGAGACLSGDLNPTWLTYLCVAFGRDENGNWEGMGN